MLPLLVVSLSLAAPPVNGLSVASGFEVTEFAGSELANDITCMTLDPKGRVIVAGRGYIRALIDSDGDGRAERAVDVSSHVNEHAMGLLWEGDTLLAVVDGGLQRFRIGADGTTAVGRPERIRALKTDGEHTAHAIRRGPDGWLYLLGGDSTGFDLTFASLASSPIRRPIGGCLVRISPDFRQTEIFADGFRNPYAFDFDDQGFPWTFDSDNERCVSLPWYEPTRIYRVLPGGHHGWRAHQLSESWRCPPYFPDVVSPVATVGRGSPTGVVFQRHPAWPLDRHGLFVADWTFGKVWRLPLNSDQPEIFLETTGDEGFAPTALVVHPESGDLLVSIGGRGTRGAVFRVRWTGPRPDSPKIVQSSSVFGVEWRPELETIIPDQIVQARTSHERARALVELRRHRDRFDNETIRRLAVLAATSKDAASLIAAADVLASLRPADMQPLRDKAAEPIGQLLVGYALLGRERNAALDLAVRVLEGGPFGAGDELRSQRLGAVRLIQLALGDLTANDTRAKVWAGYTPAVSAPPDRHPRARRALRELYPSGNAELDRELSRTLAMLEDDNPATFAAIVGRLTPESDPVDDIHHLIVLSRLRIARRPEWTTAITSSLLDLDRKMIAQKWKRDRNWPLRIAELYLELARKDLRLNDQLLNHPTFGRPEHALFTRCPGFGRRKAAERFVALAAANPDFTWDGELVELLGELPPNTHMPILRRLAEQARLREAVLPLLAKSAQAQDVPHLLVGLTSPRLDIVRTCLIALSRLPLPKDGETALSLVRCLRMLPEGKEADRLREMTAALLEAHSGEKLGTTRQVWADWLARTHSEVAKRLGGSDGVDVTGWRARLAMIKWESGDAERGREVYTRTGCAACHSGGQAMGPDLAGVTGRFSRDDLFTAILRPNQDVSSRYRTTLIETKDGKSYQGLIVYEAVDGLILQTGPAQTVRLAGDRIESRRLTETTLMPSGLLDKLNDGEIADLFAYMKSLTKPN